MPIFYRPCTTAYLLLITLFSSRAQNSISDTSQHTGLLNINYFDDRDTLIEDIWIDDTHGNFALQLNYSRNEAVFLKKVDGSYKHAGAYPVEAEMMACLQFEDLNGDGAYETMLGTGRNMNGNQWFQVFIYDRKGDSIYRAGTLNTDYKVNYDTKTIAETYEGSWYMEQTKTLYKWYGNNLVPEKMVVITGNDGAKGSVSYLEYHTNPTHKPNGLIRTLHQKRNSKDPKQQGLWNRFFQTK